MMRLVLALILAQAAPAPAEGPVMTTDVEIENLTDGAYLIGKELRCPVCQGMPIADSPSKMAVAMMKRVRELHDEGKTHDEIVEYFVQSYGEWVLLKPRAEGITWFVWILPPLGLLIGVILVMRYIRQSEASGAPKQEAAKEVPATTDDDYLRAVREEVDS